jgi:molybdate transport system ATP-binding protein
MSEPATLLQVALERASFRLEFEAAWDARVVVLFGPSGAGKSTLLRAILGLLPGARARVRLGGRWLEDAELGLRLPTEARELGWVPQDPALFPHLSVRGNLELAAARARGRAGPSLLQAAEMLEIEGLLERDVAQLSGGERQRVAIARALASRPRALLLDEPLASLDLPLRARVLPYLLRLRDELDLPILHITHDPDEAMLIGELALVLDAGRLVASGPPREVLWSRAVLPLSEALGIENVLEARVLASGERGSRLESRGGLRLDVPARLEPGESVSLGVRAEDLLLAIDPPGRISARNVFEARVASCERRGTDALVTLAAGAAGGERLVARVTPAALDELALAPGARVHVILKAQAIRKLAGRLSSAGRAPA